MRARLRQHNAGDSLATAHRNPWKLIYYEAYSEQADALGRERYLKSGAGRRFLQSQLKNYLRKFPRKEPRERSSMRVTHLLSKGYDIRTVQELLGHKDVSTTMICTYVLNKPGIGVKSPLD